MSVKVENPEFEGQTKVGVNSWPTVTMNRDNEYVHLVNQVPSHCCELRDSSVG